MREVKKINRLNSRSFRFSIFVVWVIVLVFILMVYFWKNPIIELIDSLNITDNLLKIFISIISIYFLLGIIVNLFINIFCVDTDYNPNIELIAKQSDLVDVYKTSFKISLLSNEDIENIKYNWFVTKLNLFLVAFLNVITLWWFFYGYYWNKHKDLPKIKEDDPFERNIIWNHIPFYNIYKDINYRLRLVDRLNFQHKIRGKKNPISRVLMVIDLIFFWWLPILNIIPNITIWSFLVFQIQSAINDLVDEKEYLDND